MLGITLSLPDAVLSDERLPFGCQWTGTLVIYVC